ncbi:hypothetical protein [Photobacterium damselae]|uniref:hypothetical protein n=1 Tax=Photobacterium damselae TaxID=38293 RepID=UPI002F4014F0
MISISDITVQVMERYRLGAWLGLYERWQQKPSEELHRASIAIESLIKNGLQNQALLEEWRAFLADNLAIIDRPEWNSLLNQSLDDMGLYESAIQLAMVVKQSDDFTVREKN